MVFNELTDYDASVHLYNAYCYDDVQGRYWFVVATQSVEIKRGNGLFYASFSNKGSVIIYYSNDGSNWNYYTRGNNVSRLDVFNTTDKDWDVQYNVSVEIGNSGDEEVETTPTPSPAPGDGGEGGDNTETPGETTQPGETTSPEQTTSPNVDVTVVIGDEVIEAITEIQTANNEIVEAQHITNGLMTTVLFFFIFVWAEKRIKHAVRSFTGRGLNE